MVKVLIRRVLWRIVNYKQTVPGTVLQLKREMPDGSYERRRRRRRDVGSFITSFNLRCAMFNGSLIAATPPVDRQEKSSYADKDSPSARRDSFCESAFPTLRREPMLCLRQRASPTKRALKSMYTPSRGSLTLGSRFYWPIYGRYFSSEKVDAIFFSHRLLLPLLPPFIICIDTIWTHIFI